MDVFSIIVKKKKKKKSNELLPQAYLKAKKKFFP